MFQSNLSDVCGVIFITKPCNIAMLADLYYKAQVISISMLARLPTPTGFEFDPYGMYLNLACDHLALLNGTISECARCGETTVREEKNMRVWETNV